MSSSCPSCGSSVGPGTAVCPVCGEPLEENPLLAEGYGLPAVTNPEAAVALPAATPPEAAKTKKTAQICPQCTRENLPDAKFCSNCGASLAKAPPRKKAPAAPVMVERSRSGAYMISLLGVMLIAGGVFIVAPKYYPAPQPGANPTGEQQVNGMPQGHPPTDDAPKGPTPEQQQLITDAEKALAANPKDPELKLNLADRYYDGEQYPMAIPLYREYLELHPDNDNVRTDMAFSIVASNGSVDTAAAELNRVARHDPKHQNAAYYLSMIYYSRKNRDSTIYWLNRVLQIDSTTRQGKFAASVLKGLNDSAAASPHGAPGM
jgi:cytochrome c-type biogenesis protein CcmH/NrfG/RNA polymerase subunit RPABC4/transcription elongation factor Spt4